MIFLIPTSDGNGFIRRAVEKEPIRQPGVVCWLPASSGSIIDIPEGIVEFAIIHELYGAIVLGPSPGPKHGENILEVPGSPPHRGERRKVQVVASFRKIRGIRRGCSKASEVVAV
jgi:hypothetical protein